MGSAPWAFEVAFVDIKLENRSQSVTGPGALSFRNPGFPLSALVAEPDPALVGLGRGHQLADCFDQRRDPIVVGVDAAFKLP